MKSRIVNVLSVDVEEYYHALMFQRGAGTGGSGALPSRVERTVSQLLDILEGAEVLGTFFVLGEVAAAHPALVRGIAKRGHEVACHGHRHELVSSCGPQRFQADIRQAKSILEDLAGEDVVGYRAPNFSIGPSDRWAYDVLLEEGFRYDSSVFPIVHDRYGQPRAPRFPYVIHRTATAELREFPIGTVRLLGVNLPIGGGGYFRLLPLTVTGLGIEAVNRIEERPVMFYVHPWELDADQPRPAMPWRYRFRHYVGLSRQATKLSRLVRHFRFGRARDVLGIYGGTS